MRKAEIRSADTSAQLSFSQKESDYFVVTYVSPGASFSRRVWGYTDCNLLVELFEYMAREWKGWDGEISWASPEGDFSLIAVSDKKGHISLKLRLSQTDDSEPWQADVTLNLESGLMNNASHQIRDFFIEK